LNSTSSLSKRPSLLRKQESRNIECRFLLLQEILDSRWCGNDEKGPDELLARSLNRKYSIEVRILNLKANCKYFS
jgi:hypothetical protein